MKTLIQGLLLLCLVATSSFAFANTPPKEGTPVLIYLDAEGGDLLKLRLANLQRKTTYVRLADMDGYNYFEETVQDHNGFSTLLNLRKVPNGRYIIQAKQDDAMVSVVVRIQEDLILISQDKRS